MTSTNNGVERDLGREEGVKDKNEGRGGKKGEGKVSRFAVQRRCKGSGKDGKKRTGRGVGGM